MLLCVAGATFFASLAAAYAEPPYRPDTGETPRRLTPGTLRVASPPEAAGSVYLYWTGTIASPMAEQINTAFEAFKSTRRRVVLHFDSGGGSVMEGERVIAVLHKIRSTHQLDTAVGPGSRCGSMCLPLYLQGQTRFGARSSSWLFHEITRPGSYAFKQKRVEGSYARLITKYWLPAGVSRSWIDGMLKLTDNHDWWQTGQELIAANSGIITRPIDNRRPRNLEIEMSLGAPGVPAGRRRQAPSTAPVALPTEIPAASIPPLSSTPPPAPLTPLSDPVSPRPGDVSAKPADRTAQQ